MKNLYAVFFGTKWAITGYNKRKAIAFAKANHAEVRFMPNPESHSWDAPTFRVCSDQIADFRS